MFIKILQVKEKICGALVAFQRAQVAAHFARQGDYSRAQKIIQE